jgi:hypothetical protein
MATTITRRIFIIDLLLGVTNESNPIIYLLRRWRTVSWDSEWRQSKIEDATARFAVSFVSGVQIGTFLLNRINKVNKTCFQSFESQMRLTAQIQASENFFRTNRIR